MFEQFRKRSIELERLDTGDYTDAEYARWQREMRFIHGIFGEVRALKSTLIRDVKDSGASCVSILDVGCGTGNLLRQIEHFLPQQIPMLVGVEIDPEGARATGRGLSVSEGGLRELKSSLSIKSVRADGLRLPFGDNTFDFAYCTLLLHHLSDEAAVQLMREMNRVARRRVYFVDLNRDAKAYYLYRALAFIFFQPLTSHDGALSILRSRTAKELGELAKSAGLANAAITRSKVNRLVLTGGGE